MEMNIFTDASITKTPYYNETIGCAGAICLEDNSLSKFEIVRDGTNNISEITAVKLAVELALENRWKFDAFNIWADSQWAIFGLTKWLRSWVDNMDNYILKNSSGQPVKNQQLFLSIIKTIVINKLKVNFFHIKGHVDINNFKSINKAIETFYNANNAIISRESMYDAARMNNMVDHMTRDILKKYDPGDPVTLSRGLIIPILLNEDLITYYNLVTLGGNKI